jgi:putative addiction module CopG family antidote
MATTRTVTLTDEQAAYVRQRVAEGAFPDADAVFAAGLRLLADVEADERRVNARFRELAQPGIDAIERGEFTTIEPGGVGAFVDTLRDDVRRRGGTA